MLKRKPSFATFWLPIAAVSFAHLMFPGVASALPAKPNTKLKTAEQIAPPPALVPDTVVTAPAATNDKSGYMSLDQAKSLIPGLDLSYSGGQLVIHGLVPQECGKKISIRNTDTDSTIQAGNIGGVAIYNNGGALKCLAEAGACKDGTSPAGDCEKLSSRPDAKMSLKNVSRNYDYLNVDKNADADINAVASGLHMYFATSSADALANAQSSLEENFKSCVKDGKLNDANSILNNNPKALAGVMDDLKSQLTDAQTAADTKAAAKEKIQTGKDADKLVKTLTAAQDKDDFDYKDANSQITAFLDEHPEQGNKFAQMIIDMAASHTSTGNPTAADVAESKEALEAALNTDYTYSDKNRKNLEDALNKGIPRANDRVTFLKDAELAQKGNPMALMKFEQSYAKKISKLSSDYNKKCVQSDKANAQACEDMATELSDMEAMPQQVMAQAQQNNLVQQQAMAQIFNPSATTQSSQYGSMGMQQQNPTCMYNPTACMTISNPYMASNSYGQIGGTMTGQVNNGQTFSPQMYANGATAMPGSMPMTNTMPLLQPTGYSSVPMVNNTQGMYLSH